MNLFGNLSGTIAPWLLSVLLVLSALAFIVAAKNWREMKRSPYFFQRLQAGKRLQAYLSTSFVLFVIGLGITAYAWRAPTDETPRVAILNNTKPVKQEIRELFEESPLVEAVPDTAVTAQQGEPIGAQLVEVSDAFSFASPTLPDEFNRTEPTAELGPDTELGTLNFSTEVSDDYEAVNAGQIFPEGFYTLYATFTYNEMRDGLEWAWVWRHNGEVVEGGNELWAYGESGPGYIYFNPEEGFEPGQYSLEVWVNEELLTASTIVVNSSALSAGN